MGETSVSNPDIIDEHNGSREKQETVCASAELLIKLPNGEMLPLSKLPMTKENSLRIPGESNLNEDNSAHLESTTKRLSSMETFPNTSKCGDVKSKQNLKNILGSKLGSSTAPDDGNKIGDPIISVVQVRYDVMALFPSVFKIVKPVYILHLSFHILIFF